jgi:hypothetical protein
MLHLKNRDFLIPVYLNNADPLPPYIVYWQYMDCRESNKIQLRKACREIVNTFK